MLAVNTMAFMYGQVCQRVHDGSEVGSPMTPLIALLINALIANIFSDNFG